MIDAFFHNVDAYFHTGLFVDRLAILAGTDPDPRLQADFHAMQGKEQGKKGLNRDAGCRGQEAIEGVRSGIRKSGDPGDGRWNNS